MGAQGCLYTLGHIWHAWLPTAYIGFQLDKFSSWGQSIILSFFLETVASTIENIIYVYFKTRGSIARPAAYILINATYLWQVVPHHTSQNSQGNGYYQPAAGWGRSCSYGEPPAFCGCARMMTWSCIDHPATDLTSVVTWALHALRCTKRRRWL